MGVHHPPASAPYCLRIALERKTKPRPEVLIEVRNVRTAVASRSSRRAARKLDCPQSTRDRVLSLGVEEGHTVVLFLVGRIKIPAQSKVQSQPRTHLPV